MIESNPLGRPVRIVLKILFIVIGLGLIVVPMIGTRGYTAGMLGGVIVNGVCTVFGLVVAAYASMLARVLIKIKPPSPVLMGIEIAAIIVGYALGYFLARIMLNLGLVLGIIVLIAAFFVAAFCTAQTGLLLSLAAVSPLLLDDEDHETLRRNVKDNAIPREFTTAAGGRALDRILFEQGLVSRDYIRMSDK